MDPFKIKVTDEVSNTKIQYALFELGCEWFGSTNEVKPLANCWIDVGSNGRLTWSFHGSDEKELTLPQLRDLVVLKRNDVKDATHEDQYGDKWLYLDERHYVYLNDQWDLPIGEFLERYELKPILPVKNQDPALISGAEALRALIEGLHVEMSDSDLAMDWTEICVKDGDFYGKVEPCLWMFLNQPEHIQFRLKPQTIKLNGVEVPAPDTDKMTEDDICWHITGAYECGYANHKFDPDHPYILGVWSTEEKIKQVVAALRSVLRGTNS